MINLELYKIFVLVAKEENLTRASEKLNLTQPAVTKHIKNLEEILQAKLFVRSNHGIKLTEQGKSLYDEIKESVNTLMNADKKIYGNRNINLGIHSTILNKIFSKCISDFYKVNQKSKINIFNFENDEMILKLKNKELDIVFSKKIKKQVENKDIKFIELGRWNDILIVGNNSKLANKKLKIEDIKKETLYMPKKSSETTSNFLNSINCKYEEFCNIKHVTYKTIVEIVKNNDGIGLVTKEFVAQEIKNNEIKILDIDFKITPIEFGIYLNRNSFKELKQFVDVIKHHFLDIN